METHFPQTRAAFDPINRASFEYDIMRSLASMDLIVKNAPSDLLGDAKAIRDAVLDFAEKAGMKIQ